MHAEKPVTDEIDLVANPTLYREGMARYAGHVQIVTTRWQGRRRGVTVTAACSVSDDPPTVLVCLNNSNPKNAIFAESGVFALNALASHHRDLATAFAGLNGMAEEERFGLASWGRLATGAPVLEGAAAVFDCHVTEIKEMSTHFVLFGRVVAVELGQHSSTLLYHRRGFRELP